MKTVKEKINKQTGEIYEPKLNEVITVITRRPDGTLRIQQDYSNCPTMAEQHTGHLSDVNYLIERYKPDELAAYLAARDSHRPEINNHDFFQEPSLQDAMNVVYQSKQSFENLPWDLKKNFRNHVEFLKFIDNPANAEKMQRMGLLTQEQIDTLRAKPNTATENKHSDDAGGATAPSKKGDSGQANKKAD